MRALLGFILNIASGFFSALVKTRLFGQFVLQIISNLLAVIICNKWLDGFSFSGGVLVLIEIAVFLAIFNFILKPLLKFFFGPLIVLTLGVALLLINASGLWLADFYFQSLTIKVGLPLIYATIIFSVVNSTLHIIFRQK